jgi:prepilin-type N-terminal cleavage/methylation domain-containing protein
MNNAQNNWQSRRAFTLMEIIVVITIIVIMSSLIVPRLSGNEKRQFKVTVDQVGDLLTMYAQRQSLGQKMVGILHDRRVNSLTLMELDDDGGSKDHIANWRVDPYVDAVKLPPFMIDSDVMILMDGDSIDASDYPLSCETGQARPTIEIGLRGAGETASLVLAPYGVAPVLSSSFESRGAIRTKYDLDASGRSREDW